VTTYIKSAGESSERSKEPIRNAISAIMMTIGNETIGAARIAAGGVAEAETLPASASVPGSFKRLFDGRRDAGVDIGGDGDTEEVGEPFVAFHVAVAAKRDNGAEYELNKPKRPPDGTLAI
jgi:hypothetical protein